MDDSDTLVYTADGDANAQQVKAFLDAHGIPSALRGEAARQPFPVAVDGLGAIEIHVPLELVAQARELIAEVEAGRMEIGPDIPPTSE